MPNQWLILEPDYIGGIVDPPQFPPSIEFDSTSIRVTEGALLSNIARWTDVDTTLANPIASIIQTGGPGSLGPNSNPTLQAGEITWTLPVAELAHDGTTITIVITDGDGHQDTAEFTLNVDPIIPPDDGITECDGHNMPTTITADLSEFAKGELEIVAVSTSNITPDWHILNGTTITFSGPSTGDAPLGTDCGYPAVDILAVPAHPDGAMCPTVNLRFTLGWAEDFAGGGETWLLRTIVSTDSGCGDNADDEFTGLEEIPGPSTGNDPWLEHTVTWPPGGYDGSQATPPWDGKLIFSDSIHGSGDAPVSTLIVDPAPANPARVTIQARTITSDTTVLVNESLVILSATGPGPTPILLPVSGPIPPIIDLSPWEGKQVTMGYSGEDSAGKHSTTVEAVVDVPVFLQHLTVDPALPPVLPNFQSLTAAIAALNDRGQIKVAAGTYTNDVAGEGSQWNIGGRHNCSIVAVTDGTVILDHGNNTALNTFLTTGATTNNRIQGFEFRNTESQITHMSPGCDDMVIESCICTSSGPRGSKRGFYSTGGDRHVYIDCHVDGLTASGGGSSGTGFEARVGNEVTYWGCTSSNNVNGFRAADGQTNSLYQFVAAHSNASQGLLTAEADGIIIEDSIFGEDISGNNPSWQGNGATGIQIEADWDDEFAYTTDTEIRRCTFSGNSLLSPGEKNCWIDDSERFLIEDCVMVNGGATGLQADADPASRPASTKPPHSGKLTKFGVMRFNIILDTGNAASPVGDRLGIGIKAVVNTAIYNNTVRNTGTALDNHPTVGLASNHRNLGVLPDNDNTFLNNVIEGTVQNLTGEDYGFAARQVIIGSGVGSVKHMDGNVYSNPPSLDKGYQIGQVKTAATDFDQFQIDMNPHEQNSIEVPDIMVDSNHRPIAGSPLIGNSQNMSTVTNIDISGLIITLSSTDWVWGYHHDINRNDTVVFPNGRVRVISKTVTTITIDESPPGGISIGHTCNLWRKTGTADAGALQS